MAQFPLEFLGQFPEQGGGVHPPALLGDPEAFAIESGWYRGVDLPFMCVQEGGEGIHLFGDLRISQLAATDEAAGDVRLEDAERGDGDIVATEGPVSGTTQDLDRQPRRPPSLDGLAVMDSHVDQGDIGRAAAAVVHQEVQALRVEVMQAVQASGDVQEVPVYEIERRCRRLVDDELRDIWLGQERRLLVILPRLCAEGTAPALDNRRAELLDLAGQERRRVSDRDPAGDVKLLLVKGPE